MKFLKQFAIVLYAAVSGLALTAPIVGCTAAQESAFLTNAPAVLQGTLATATDLYAAYDAANQQLNGQKLTVSTGLTAAKAAAANLQSSNLSDAVNGVFSGLNNLASSLKAAGASNQQIVAAQSAQIVAAQVATKAAASPAGVASTAMLQFHYDSVAQQFVVKKDFAPVLKKA